MNESVEDYLRYAAHADLKPDNIEQMRRNVKLRPEIKKIEENGATLSGGEKKKLLMLKWLLNPSTSFVILDEIDAGLDDETKVVLKELEKELLKDRKKIVMKISHIDEDMDRNLAERVVVGSGQVALLAEGVDRNLPTDLPGNIDCGRPPRGGRG